MKLIRLYAWSCVVALPILLGLGALYLYLEADISVGATLVILFAIIAATVAAVVMRDTSADDFGSEA